MTVRYSLQFRKQYKKLPKKTREQFKERLAVLAVDPKTPILRIHKLAGKYEGLWSMNVSGDIRAIFDRSFEDTVLFIAIGSHSQLYS